MEILIIKLGAKGDIVRTLPLISAIKHTHEDANISLVTKKQNSGVFENNKDINHLFTLPFSSDKKFDILYNLDIDGEATTLANNVSAEKKLGFYDSDGFPAAFNLAGEYYLNTLFDDEIKKTNTKTYQEMIFAVAEIPWNNNPIKLNLTEKSTNYASDFSKKHNLGKHVIGIHMGAGKRWPSKAWHPECVEKFIELAHAEGNRVILFGGPDEIETHKIIKEKLSKKNISISSNNIDNTDQEFFSLINLCSAIVCSDSFALHVSLALNKPTVGMFFVTSPAEVEGYGILKKLVSPMLKDFFPERSDEYNVELTKSISPEQVISALKELKAIK